MNHLEVIGRGVRKYRGLNFLANRSHHLHRPSDGDEPWQIRMSSLQRQVDLYFVHEFLMLQDRVGQGVYVRMKGLYHITDDNGLSVLKVYKPLYHACYMDRTPVSLFMVRLTVSTLAYELFKPIGGPHYEGRSKVEIHIHLYDIDRVLA